MVGYKQKSLPPRSTRRAGLGEGSAAVRASWSARGHWTVLGGGLPPVQLNSWLDRLVVIVAIAPSYKTLPVSYTHLTLPTIYPV